jgi:hypothetical protein
MLCPHQTLRGRTAYFFRLVGGADRVGGRAVRVGARLGGRAVRVGVRLGGLALRVGVRLVGGRAVRVGVRLGAGLVVGVRDGAGLAVGVRDGAGLVVGVRDGAGRVVRGTVRVGVAEGCRRVVVGLVVRVGVERVVGVARRVPRRGVAELSVGLIPRVVGLPVVRRASSAGRTVRVGVAALPLVVRRVGATVLPPVVRRVGLACVAAALVGDTRRLGLTADRVATPRVPLLLANRLRG